ncbi:hypothetical protein BC936DRAFT_147904 [Jimgerdemannia flammicorona]|uniref:Uncharacterized protein n=2 Tax=Jimgerdemannia flammicorona TaxID=994334 RepID=A0A433D4A6_9FUNG|nr:hypothetical protein BC936DRAFT_147904 [Jimgerdemannia flammicorona]RUS29865.1 hypothetical protein BC938DRAFT_480137 [Jimgerdemannia flammicorona]
MHHLPVSQGQFQEVLNIPNTLAILQDPMVIAALASQLQQYNQDESAISSETIAPRDEQGLMDCQLSQERIHVKDLVPQMLNVTLLGRIVAMAQNNPIMKDGIAMDRYAIRLADSTGRIDITLWESVGRSARRLQPGQYVLITGLSTSPRHQDSRGQWSWHVNGSELCDTKVWCVSKLKSSLASSAVQFRVNICDAAEFDNFQCCAVVTAWFVADEQTNDNQALEGILKDMMVLTRILTIG